MTQYRSWHSLDTCEDARAALEIFAMLHGIFAMLHGIFAMLHGTSS